MAHLEFTLGGLYAHDEIISNLEVGNSGGIRVSVDGKGRVDRVVLFSTAQQETTTTDNPYQDRISGNILEYTGTGRFGGQSLAGPNLRLTQQALFCFPIYVFSLVNHRKTPNSPSARWRFLGLYRYVDHRRETQGDLLGLSRAAWVFRLLNLQAPKAGINSEATALILLRNSLATFIPTALPNGSYSSAILDPIIRKISNLAAPDFERFIEKILTKSNFRHIRVTKKSADKGIDVLAHFPENIWITPNQLIQIQAKRWKNPVGRREIAELRGSLSPRALGVIITTSTYTQTAITEAERPNTMPISLVDGHCLAIAAKRLEFEL